MKAGAVFLMLAISSVHAEPSSELKTIPVVPLDDGSQDKGPKFGFVLGASAEFGGGKVATVSFQDGSSQNIRAGQGFGGFAGGTIRLSPTSPWSARLTAGYKYTTTKATNASINLGRVPLEFIGSYRFDRGFRVGTGVAYHTAIKLDGDGYFENVKFHDAVGFKVEAGWKWIVATYTNLRYRASNVDGSADASSFGVGLLWEF